MALEDVIAQRYQGYITIEEVVQMIASEYSCSESDALLVLADAIEKKIVKDNYGNDSAYPLQVYSRKRLGPEITFDGDDILRCLINNKGKVQEGLNGIPF